jgi:hypothetical protein
MQSGEGTLTDDQATSLINVDLDNAMESTGFPACAVKSSTNRESPADACTYPIS